MNIGILLPEIYNCGPVNVALNIVKELSKLENVDIMVISLRPLKNNETLDFFKKYSSLGVYALNENNYFKDLKNIALHLDVIHSHGFYPDKLVSKLDGNIKKITTVHCMFYKDYIKEYGIFKGFIGALSHFRILNKGRFDTIVGCSLSVRYYCEKHLNNKININYILNGVDQTRFYKLSAGKRMELRKDLNFDVYKRIYIYAGRLIRRKRVPELIDLFLIKAQHDDLLIILGDGEELDECKERAAQGNIKLIGNVDNPEFYYQISDFVISNSSAEGYPMSIIEAVSCGCFAFLSDIEPHREFVSNNPQVSCLLDVWDECKVLSEESVEHLSARVMALSYLNVYEQ
ncbi:glycosyltransferase family 4 protein [Acinetobacter nosocomialis]|uniref:glycosyltransferase family 4 protein n=1 Tax=Acinetobacter nosocomialis TaxID=106654 RepID=UPI0029D963F7|nr:glycosyltransferase family 4 protein [Acinetobacter nosocomialis]MDX7881733.1 glycosyltransferase family 4 protein [Acinetobacter nosocomialis]